MSAPDTEVIDTPDAQVNDDGTFIACHRSWVVGFQPQEVPPTMHGGKIIHPGGKQMVPVPGMMPCLGSQCGMWDAAKQQCIERTVAEAAIGRSVPRVLPEGDDHKEPIVLAPVE